MKLQKVINDIITTNTQLVSSEITISVCLAKVAHTWKRTPYICAVKSVDIKKKAGMKHFIFYAFHKYTLMCYNN